MNRGLEAIRENVRSFFIFDLCSLLHEESAHELGSIAISNPSPRTSSRLLKVTGRIRAQASEFIPRRWRGVET